MAYVTIPKDLSKVQSKVWFNKIALAHLNKKITQKILKYKKKLETLYGQKLLESIIKNNQQNSILIMLDTLSTTTKRIYEDILTLEMLSLEYDLLLMHNTTFSETHFY